MQPKQQVIPNALRPALSSYWDSRYGRSLTPDEQRELEGNLGGFFDLLNEIQSQQNRKNQPKKSA
jgi:hypothetical protein